MAVVGDAYIVVRAITSGFEKDVRKAARGINMDKDGRSVGESFSKGFSQGVSRNLGNSLSGFGKEALAARAQFQSLIRTSYTFGTALSVLVSSVGSLVGGLISLGAAALAAAPSLVALGGLFTSLGLAAIVTKGAFAGVNAAISAGNKANKDSVANTQAIDAAKKALTLSTEKLAEAEDAFAKAAARAREEVQQLGFDAEDAAIGEKKAAIELEKARETLARVQDLPPNSRARREAQLAFAEAELNYRKSKDRNLDIKKQQKDLEDAAARAGTEQYKQTDTYLNAQKAVIDAAKAQVDAKKELEKAKSGGSGFDAFQKALDDLSPQAQSFVKFMVDEFVPALKKLRDAAGELLFPELETALTKLKTDLFRALTPLVKTLGGDVGTAFTSMVASVTEFENKMDLKKVFETAGTVVKDFGVVAGAAYDSILSVLVGADPIIRKFSGWLVTKSTEFAKFLDTKQATGELEAFFNKAGDIAAEWGKIFGNIFGGITNVIKANFSPGGGGYVIIDWLKQLTGDFKAFSGSVGGQKALSEFFKGVSTNSVAALQSIGAFLKVILKAGADPNIKIFWDIIKQAAPSFEKLLTGANAAGPALAKLIVSLIEFASVTLSSGAMETFFNVLTTGMNFLTNIMKDPAMQDLFNFGAKIAAAFSAFGLAANILAFGGKVIAGALMPIVKIFTEGPMLARGLVTAIADIAGAFGLAVGPFLAIVAAVAAVIAAFVLMYDKSEIFRNAIKDLVSAVGGALKDAFDTIKQALTEVQPQIDGVMGVFKTLGDILGRTVVPILKVVLVGAIKVVAAIIADLIKAVFGIAGAFSSISKPILAIFNGISIGIKGIIDGIKSAINSLIKAWNSTLGKVKITLPKVGPFGGGSVGFPTIPEFADGGTVYPSSKGTIARVAEAGRPERIEPLDPQGLSKRDRAMIEMLAGGNGGNTFNIYPSAGMNESELAAMVSRQIAFQMRRGGA